MAEQRWSDETEQLAAEAIGMVGDVIDPDRFSTARRVLAALADSGLLLPEGGETRDLYMVQTTGVRWPCATEAAAWAQFAKVKAWPEKGTVEILRQAVTEWPDGREYRSAWEAVGG